MSCILHIETSTNICSVALSQDGQCIYEDTNSEGMPHATKLPPFVESAISFADSHIIPIDAVAVSIGPGSYTGLRIGVSTAKGICYGRELPLITIPTLEILCVPVLLYNDEIPDDALLCPMLDARRMEVYAAVYDRALKVKRETQAEVIDETSFHDLFKEHPIYFFGNGSDKCKDILTHRNAHFLPDIAPLARNMYPLAERAMARRQFADVAYSEPFYLKDFITSTPKKLV